MYQWSVHRGIHVRRYSRYVHRSDSHVPVQNKPWHPLHLQILLRKSSESSLSFPFSTPICLLCKPRPFICSYSCRSGRCRDTNSLALCFHHNRKKQIFLPIFVFQTCHYVKSYKPCKDKKKDTPWELAHKGVSFFLDLYGDNRTSAGTSVSANGYGLILISHLYFQTASLLLRPRP